MILPMIFCHCLLKIPGWPTPREETQIKYRTVMKSEL
jgi:hypothetical protein